MDKYFLLTYLRLLSSISIDKIRTVKFDRLQVIYVHLGWFHEKYLFLCQACIPQGRSESNAATRMKIPVHKVLMFPTCSTPVIVTNTDARTSDHSVVANNSSKVIDTKENVFVLIHYSRYSSGHWYDRLSSCFKYLHGSNETCDHSHFVNHTGIATHFSVFLICGGNCHLQQNINCLI